MLPSEHYTEPHFLDLEIERIFFRTWQWVGSTSQLRTPESYFCHDLLGEPLVLARGEDGTARGFYNVCRHRAGPVAEGEGHCRGFTCRYHGWSYRLDGKLIGAREMPEIDEAQNWRKDQVGLRPIAVSQWGPLLLVNLSQGAEPLTRTLEPLQAALEAAGLSLAEAELLEERDYSVESNWKVYVDNYLEGYHIPIVHPGLFRLLDYDRYEVTPFAGGALQTAPVQRESNENEETEQAVYCWLFPNLMLNFYPNNLQINIVVPVSQLETRVRFIWYRTGADAEKAIRDSIELGNQVQKEDAAICAAVQRGLSSRSYDLGPYCSRHENGVRHFHELLSRYLDMNP